MNGIIIFLFPFCMDIVAGLVLFVGRHSLASRGFDESVVGTVPLCFGIFYIVSCLIMGKVIRPSIARMQMTAGAILFAVLCAVLANVESVRAIQVTFCFVPFASALFFNAFQSFMLKTSTETVKPLMTTSGQYTFAWSLGFAFGPLFSSLLKTHATWSQTYYLAAAFAVAVAVGGLLYRPKPAPSGAAAPAPQPAVPDGPSLTPISWTWLTVGWGIWLMTSTFWPVRATALELSPLTKGGVEFALAATQAFAALGLIRLRNWTVNTSWLPLFGAVGAAGLVMFGFARTPLQFIAAVMLYGVHTAAMFNYMMYHALIQPAKAVKRVAINEMFIGVCFMAGPAGAALLSGSGLSFSREYTIVAGVLMLTVTVLRVAGGRLVRVGIRG